MQFHITQNFKIVHGLEKIHAKCNGDKQAMARLKMVMTKMCSDTKRGSMLLVTTSPGSVQGCGADRAHIAPLVQVSRAPRWVQLRG